MLVKVTQEHIDKGLQNWKDIKDDKSFESLSSSCPVALALRDSFKVNWAQATVFELRVGMFPENLVFYKQTPYKASVWINNFDCENPVKPFEFELSLEGVKL